MWCITVIVVNIISPLTDYFLYQVIFNLCTHSLMIQSVKEVISNTVDESIGSSIWCSPDDVELLSVSLNLQPPLLLCTVYVPPNASMEYVTSLCSYMLTMSRSSDNLVVVGDFNFPDICWSTLCSSSPSSTRFCDGVFDCNLTQLVTAPTHIMGNLLDLVLVSGADSISSLRVHPEADSPFKSDHYMVSFALRVCMSYLIDICI